jgi:flagellar motility protein MotE (MotC chaperone)
LPLWVLATGVALAAAPATPPVAPAPRAQAASAEGAPKRETETDASKGQAKEAAKDAPKGAAKEPAKETSKKDGEVAKPDGEVVKKDGEAAKSVAKKDGPDGVPSAAPAEPSALKQDGAPPIAGPGAPRSRKAEAAGAASEEPAPPTGPPLKISALRDEMNRPPRKEERGTLHAERERLEQLAAEINKAREELRQDTARLEAMLAARDAAGANGGATNDSGEPAKKIPSPLDNLAKAIRGMKPEQAAPILSRVERKLAADVLLRMPGADAGKVMGVCKPEVAAELAAEIASRSPRAELRR